MRRKWWKPFRGMDAVILGTEVFNRNVIDHADKLKIVSRYGVGLDKIDVEYLKEKGIALQIARNANTNSVADHTIGLMLSLCHNITRSDANIRSHVWKKADCKGFVSKHRRYPWAGCHWESRCTKTEGV